MVNETHTPTYWQSSTLWPSVGKTGVPNLFSTHASTQYRFRLLFGRLLRSTSSTLEDRKKKTICTNNYVFVYRIRVLAMIHTMGTIVSQSTSGQEVRRSLYLYTVPLHKHRQGLDSSLLVGLFSWAVLLFAFACADSARVQFREPRSLGASGRWYWTRGDPVAVRTERSAGGGRHNQWSRVSSLLSQPTTVWPALCFSFFFFFHVNKMIGEFGQWEVEIGW